MTTIIYLYKSDNFPLAVTIGNELFTSANSLAKYGYTWKTSANGIIFCFVNKNNKMVTIKKSDILDGKYNIEYLESEK